MPATKLDIKWITLARDSQTTSLPLVRNITQPRSYLRCPDCRSIIYTRRYKLCAVCGRELPEELLFNPVEASRIKERLQAEQRKHRAWMKRA